MPIADDRDEVGHLTLGDGRAIDPGDVSVVPFLENQKLARTGKFGCDFV